MSGNDTGKTLGVRAGWVGQAMGPLAVAAVLLIATPAAAASLRETTCEDVAAVIHDKSTIDPFSLGLFLGLITSSYICGAVSTLEANEHEVCKEPASRVGDLMTEAVEGYSAKSLWHLVMAECAKDSSKNFGLAVTAVLLAEPAGHD